jgi:disulfide bond formation protein DsbB
MTVRKVLILFAMLALVLAACGGSDGGGGDTPTTTSGGGTGNVVEGAGIYSGTCTACHGPNAEGIDGLGLPLAPSDFVASNSEADLAAFIKVGRPTSDPANTTGVDMPPKGGNPSLDDQDLLDVSAYIQSLN